MEMLMPERKKVLVNAIAMCGVNTGIARYLRCLYTWMESLYAREFEFHYFDGRRISPAMPHVPEDLKHRTRIVDCLWKLPSYLALAARLGLHYKREFNFYRLARGYDLYHEAGFFPLLCPAGIKTVFTVHDLSLIRFPQHHPRERVLYSRLFFARRSGLADHILTVSGFTGSEVRNHLDWPENAITVTPLAHDPEIFYPRDKQEVRAYLKGQALPGEYFLFVGSGDPRKNMDVIPGALREAGLRVPLVAVGWSGWEKRNPPDNVLQAGYVCDPDLALLYSGALALILPSTYEGFGLPVLEAMACGCPVLTSRKASLPEVGGEAAVYVEDPRDTREMAGLLSELAASPEKRQTLRNKGLNRAAEFSWRRTAELTRQAFSQVLDHG
jgi:alpha-1,3-rhamnosyl/mannosyltransferase